MKAVSLILFITLFLFPFATSAVDSVVEEKEMTNQVFSQARHYFSEFQHPETGVLYGSRLSGRSSWTSPADVLAEKPKPWGYGSRIADTALHTGHMLVALLDAYEARPDPFLKGQIGRCFEGLKLIGSLPEKYPKPNKPALDGLVPRGPHPDDISAWFDDSSMDQHTTYIISMAVFANSPLATEDDKKWIRESLGKVGRRLEKNGWSIKRADGVTQAHVGFSWKGFNSNHASILLPAVLALHYGTGDEHWMERYQFFLKEADGKRWQAAHPGEHVRINGHPIYANQNAFRVNAWYHFEKNTDRKIVIGALLKQSTQMQLDRDFPGDMYRKFHDKEVWNRVSKNFNWGGPELHGAASAWEKFDSTMLAGEDEGMAALAHVRFPLGGFHMALLSERPEIIREYLPTVWEMLSTVDLEKIAAGETHYLFTVVGLHWYGLYFRYPEYFSSVADDAAEQAIFNGKDLSGWYGLNPHSVAKFSGDKRKEGLAKMRLEFKDHWAVENGELVNDGHGPYATTEKNYGDIEFEIDYKTVAKADSGIYLRGTPQVQIWDSITNKNPKALLGSGGLHNNSEGKPGRFPSLHVDKPFGEWNHFRIIQAGSRTTVFLNGKRVVNNAIMENYWDKTRKTPLPARGPIHLQTHGGEIRWKNINLREIAPKEANQILRGSDSNAGFVSIFNGKDLSGWQGAVDDYEVKDGSIVCKPDQGGILFTDEEYSDFIVRLEFKVPPGGNNGLAIRYPGEGRAAYDGMCELQVIDNDAEKNITRLDDRQVHGSAYAMVGAHRGYTRPAGTWNYQEVTVKGSTIKVELNGTVILETDLSKVTKFLKDKPHPGKDLKQGYFGFAGHKDPVMFRNIAIKKIKLGE